MKMISAGTGLREGVRDLSASLVFEDEGAPIKAGEQREQ